MKFTYWCRSSQTGGFQTETWWVCWNILLQWDACSPKCQLPLGFLLLGVSIHMQAFHFTNKKASEVHSNLFVDISTGCRQSYANLAHFHHSRECQGSLECLFLTDRSGGRTSTAPTDCSSWLTLGSCFHTSGCHGSFACLSHPLDAEL